MVVLKAVSPPAFSALGTAEGGDRPEVKGAAQLGRQVASEMFDRVDSSAVVEDGLYEGIPAQLMGQLYW